jgi:beta-xylosidase
MINHNLSISGRKRAGMSAPGLRSFAFALAAFVMLANTGQGANPFITSIYTADPSAHVWADGRLYVYPSHDMDPARGCDLMDRYHVFSTDDMVTWRDEGEILRADQVAWGRPEGGFMWAPDCAYKDGTYYFYFPHPSGSEWNQTWKIGVASSAKPASDFKPLGFIGGLDGNSMIDPAVFTDTDGQVYLYYGGGGVCKGGKLKASMTEIDGAMASMTGLVDFHEATWVFKRNDLYYLTYADNFPGSNRMRYATSSNPLGPWTHRGIYLEPTGCDTTHGSVVEYKGQWYQFYHNQSISGHGNLRSCCVDKLNFNSDGTIQTVVQTTAGVPPVGPSTATRQDPVKYAAALSGVANGAKLEPDPAAAAGASVHELHLAGAAMQFDQVSGGNGGRATICIHYAAAGNAKLKLVANGVDCSFLNTPATGGWDAYQGEASTTIPLGAGSTNIVRLIGGNGGVNVDYLTVAPLP